MTKRINAPVMKRRGPGIDAAFRSRQGRPASSARSQFGVEWTSREERLLERHYGSMSAQELKRRFLKERTIHAIRGRAGVLGLTRPMVHRPWTPRERALVRREFSRRGGLKRLIQALGRTQMAIAGQARYMGLSRRLDGSWTAREDAVLRRYYASHGTQLPLKGKTPSAIYHRAQQLKLRRPGIIGLPWSAAEDDLLRRHRHMQSPELAKLPPRRTSQAVQKRRKKLGVPYLVSPNRPNSRDPWSEAEREILRQHFELDAPMFLHLLPDDRGAPSAAHDIGCVGMPKRKKGARAIPTSRRGNRPMRAVCGTASLCMPRRQGQPLGQDASGSQQERVRPGVGAQDKGCANCAYHPQKSP